MMISVVLLLIGFIMVIKGADLLVSGSSSLAKRFHVSELIIGLTIVAFGTSAPELVVNIMASTDGLDDVVLGNVIGSNIFNLLLILGISGIIYPVFVQTNSVWREIPYSLFAALIFFVLVSDTFLFGSDTNTLSRVDGFILLFLFFLFLIYIFINLKNESNTENSQTVQFSLFKTISFILFGLAGLIIGGRFVVENAVKIARLLSISEKLIGLTVVSIGTSLPELATSLTAAFKKKSDLVIGNIIGSNIFNILLILGTSAIISPVHYNSSFNFDLGLLIASTMFVFIAMFTGTKKKLDRWEAAVLMFVFVGYLLFLITN